MNKILIREPTLKDEASFIAAMCRSKSLHAPWIKSPQTSQEFHEYCQRYQQANQKSFLVLSQENNIAGVFNISKIIRGFFQSTYLGFYAVSNYSKKGYMSAGLKLVLERIFKEMNLHRLEANIQPVFY